MKSMIEAVRKAASEGYNAYGIRVIENAAGVLTVGDYVPDSYAWDYELDCSTRETTGETLDGACAIKVDCDRVDFDDDENIAEVLEKAIKESKKAGYYGEQVLLIGGKDGYEYGEDRHEIIIPNACVLAIAE